MRRSELGRRINGVSELLLSRESILMDLHHDVLASSIFIWFLIVNGVIFHLVKQPGGEFIIAPKIGPRIGGAIAVCRNLPDEDV